MKTFSKFKYREKTKSLHITARQLLECRARLKKYHNFLKVRKYLLQMDRIRRTTKRYEVYEDVFHKGYYSSRQFDLRKRLKMRRYFR